MAVHHAWGRTYKDLWQRYKNMQGHKQRFQNGFDCQGLWVEVEVEKELGFKNKKDIEKYGVAEFVERCKERVLKFSSMQTEQSKRLGNFMDWDNSYFTMSDDNNYMIWHFLKICHENGWIYKGRDSVAWCPRCETAISQHEMLTEDYKEITHKSIYLMLPIVGRDREYLLVWTTTPWTIPANIAVAVDEKMDYSSVGDKDGNVLWLAKERVEAIFGIGTEIIESVKGKKLVGLKYKGPFDSLPSVKKAAGESELFHTVIATDSLIMPITTTEGTGMVHTAVSAGSEDFRLGKKYSLPLIPVIADNADYLDGLDFLTGQNAKKHPEVILDYLVGRKEQGENWVLKIENYTHRYPACWRCKTELVWKIADEWYIAMDSPSESKLKSQNSNLTLRQRMVDVAKKIKWLPSFGLDRELDWLSNMHDWLISKPNRYWGLALPIYECKCGHFEVIGSKEELEERAVEGWDKFEGHTPHKPFIDEVKIKCPKCGETVSRLPHVGNVWLDAGIVSFSTIKENNKGEPLYLKDRSLWEKWFPMDFITESFPGQFKNWFYSLIAMSTVLENKNPMNTVLGYGTLLAEDGRPMHKSWGNSIEFNEGADKIGADVMRWMYFRQNPSDNMLFGYKLADEVRRQFHLKIWNVYNYFVTYANLNNWVPKGESPVAKNELDKWIMLRLTETLNLVAASLDNYNPQPAAMSVESFVDDLSNWYIRRSRGRADNEFFQTTYFVLVNLSLVIAPVSPFVSDWIYTNLTKRESVHLASWPELEKSGSGLKLISQMQFVREAVEKALAIRKETVIAVRQPLAKAQIHGLKELSQDLLELFKDEVNVKNVELKGGTEIKVELDTNLTEELKSEGSARELVRQIQDERKKIGTDLNQKIDVRLPSWPKEYEKYIKSKALVINLSEGEFKVTPRD
jgi:isoleucyl-tRNA synthetase